MAHLWFRDEGDIWSALPLGAAAVDISVHPPRALAEGFRMGVDTRAALVPAPGNGTPVWVLVAAGDGDARVNGLAPVAGVRVLQDHDEVRAASSNTLFFSTETLARVQEFPGAERAVYCGRCRQAMVKGQPAVCCPGCGIWYHQSQDLPCWTYAPSCAFCEQSTALDAGFAWMPEA
jgi:hypothetical protein